MLKSNFLSGNHIFWLSFCLLKVAISWCLFCKYLSLISVWKPVWGLSLIPAYANIKQWNWTPFGMYWFYFTEVLQSSPVKENALLSFFRLSITAQHNITTAASSRSSSHPSLPPRWVRIESSVEPWQLEPRGAWIICHSACRGSLTPLQCVPAAAPGAWNLSGSRAK